MYSLAGRFPRLPSSRRLSLGLGLIPLLIPAGVSFRFTPAAERAHGRSKKIRGLDSSAGVDGGRPDRRGHPSMRSISWTGGAAVSQSEALRGLALRK